MPCNNIKLCLVINLEFESRDKQIERDKMYNHNIPPCQKSLYGFTPNFVWNKRNFSFPNDFVITSAI